AVGRAEAGEQANDLRVLQRDPDRVVERQVQRFLRWGIRGNRDRRWNVAELCRGKRVDVADRGALLFVLPARLDRCDVRGRTPDRGAEHQAAEGAHYPSAVDGHHASSSMAARLWIASVANAMSVVSTTTSPSTS